MKLAMASMTSGSTASPFYAPHTGVRATAIRAVNRHFPAHLVTTGMVPFEQFHQQALNHTFVIAPPGNGIATHRVWETLLAGRIPVVMRATPNADVYSSLPVAFVERWERLSPEHLYAEYNRIAASSPRFDKLWLGYWYAKIHCAAREPAFTGFASLCLEVEI
jgi:hypothetical protein